MTSPDPAGLGRAPLPPAPSDDRRTFRRTDPDGAGDLRGSYQLVPDRGLSVDRLALALLLIAVFVAVPLGLLALQAA